VIDESAQLPDRLFEAGTPASYDSAVSGGGRRLNAALFSHFVMRIRTGDERAAEELVRRFEPLIRREVRVRIKSSRLNRIFDSLDVCQSVLASFFVRAATGDYDLEEPKQLVKLLVTMARNKLASKVRGEQRQRRDLRRVSAADAIAIDQLQARTPPPSEIVAGRELLERFRAGLSEEERKLATLRSEGLAWQEIADRLGGNAHARRVQLSRGVERVSRQLGLDRDAIRLNADRG